MAAQSASDCTENRRLCKPPLVVVQFKKEASQNARFLWRKKRATSRGSLRSFTSQKTLVQDDKQTAPLPRTIKLTAPSALNYAHLS